jgi:DNA-binding response OmpR family regulator
LVQHPPDGALIDLLLPGMPAVDVAHYAAARGVPALLVARREADAARLEAARCPYIAEPFDERSLIAATRALIAGAHENVRRLGASLERLRANQSEFAVARARLDETVQRTRVLHKVANERVERLMRSGVSPMAARKPTLLDDWDVMRAAQHMIESHGVRAADTARIRAEQTRELAVAKRWHAIADAVANMAREREAARPRGPAPRPPAVVPAATEAPHILLVGGNADVADAVRFMLKELGYRVSTAEDAGGARLALAGAPSLLVAHGGALGTEVGSLVEEASALGIPVLVLAEADTPAPASGAAATLRKPFHLRQLESEIARLLRR